MKPVASSMYARIVFWEPCVSPHKSAFISAVAQRLEPRVQVSWVAHAGVPEERQALGWSAGSAYLPLAVVAPDDAEIASIIERGGDACLHVFSGTRWFSTLTTALHLVKKQGRAFAIMSEPRDNAGVRGAVRFIQSWSTEAWLRRRAQFVLAIGRHGPPWFRSVGYRREQVFPFAYFLPPPDAENQAGGTAAASAKQAADAALQVAYVGRLEEKKGVQFLLPALKSLARPVQLTLIGDGELRETLLRQAHELGVDTEFCGVLPIDHVQRRMHQFDVLVLPSICKDGWGAVISEALLSGAAVVASRCTGASILLDSPRNGRVVPPADSVAIAAAIDDLARSGVLTARARRHRIKWAHQRLTAHAGASYFEQIVQHRIGAAQRPREFYL